MLCKFFTFLHKRFIPAKKSPRTPQINPPRTLHPAPRKLVTPFSGWAENVGKTFFFWRRSRLSKSYSFDLFCTAKCPFLNFDFFFLVSFMFGEREQRERKIFRERGRANTFPALSPSGIPSGGLIKLWATYNYNS